MTSHTAPKADALPGCATPRPAVSLGKAAIDGNPGDAVRGNQRQDEARTGNGIAGDSTLPRFTTRAELEAWAVGEGMNLTLERIGGNCPVQADGTFDGNAFYFRARGDSWQFHVAPTQDEIFGDTELFYIERDYGDGPFDAGWMPENEALGFIAQAALEARVTLAHVDLKGE